MPWRETLRAITEKMLIQSLKELEADEIIVRKAQSVVPPYVAYSLSKCGEDLAPVLLSIKQWAKKHNL